MEDIYNICKRTRKTCESKKDQDRRFAELSDKTKDLVRDLYKIEISVIDEEDQYEDSVVAASEGAIDLLETLFGKKNLEK